MENMTILQLQEVFKNKLQVSKRPELTMNKMPQYHSEHLKGTRSVFVKFYEDYNYARSMDNYPDLKMFTGCFNLIECIYYIDIEHSVKEEECQPAVNFLTYEQLLEYSDKDKVHMHILVKTMTEKDLTNIKQMHTRGYTIFAHDNVTEPVSSRLNNIDHLDSFLGMSFSPEMVFVALDMKDDQPAEQKSEPFLSKKAQLQDVIDNETYFRPPVCDCTDESFFEKTLDHSIYKNLNVIATKLDHVQNDTGKHDMLEEARCLLQDAIDDLDPFNTDAKESSLSSVYDLPLHEEVKINDNLRIIAVPGGWLYVSIVEGAVKTSTFVPNTLDNIAKTIFDVLNYLNDDQASINSDGDLLEYIKEYLK